MIRRVGWGFGEHFPGRATTELTVKGRRSVEREGEGGQQEQRERRG